MSRRVIRPNYPAGVETRYLNLPSNHGIFVARDPQVPPARQAWAKDGACRKVASRGGFFPVKGVPVAEVWAAVDTCITCPVNHHCLEEALAHPSKLTGLWGGTNWRDRLAIRLARPQKPTRTIDAAELGAALIEIFLLTESSQVSPTD